MKRLCTICARGGSVGVKNKNIRFLGPLPLLAYSIEQALATNLFEIIAVSSDSTEILGVAKEHGAHLVIKRPAELATHTAAKIPAIQHAVKNVEELTQQCFETLVDLDVTSPLRLPGDIIGAVKLLEEQGVKNVLTGTLARRSPYFNLVEIDEKGAVRLSKPLPKPIIRRQDSPPCYDLNASIYVWQREALFSQSTIFNFDTRLYIMPEARSLDIDTELDFKIVEYILQNGLNINE